MVKIRQKVLGGFRTDTGARIFLALKSDIQTFRKQVKDVWTGLTRAMTGSPTSPPTPDPFSPLDTPPPPLSLY